MSAPQDEIKALLALRDSINASIDAYVSLTPEQKAQKPLVNKTRQKIWSTANMLASKTINPPQGATQLAFMVCPPDAHKSTEYLPTNHPKAMAECRSAHCLGTGHIQSSWRIDHII